MAKFVCDYLHISGDKCKFYEPKEEVEDESKARYNCKCKHLNLIYCSSDEMITEIENIIKENNKRMEQRDV